MIIARFDVTVHRMKGWKPAKNKISQYINYLQRFLRGFVNLLSFYGFVSRKLLGVVV